MDWGLKEQDVIDAMAASGAITRRQAEYGVDVVDPHDYFVDGHPLSGHGKAVRERNGEAAGVTERILAKHAGEDRKRNATEANVDTAIRLLREGRRVLNPEQFESVARYMFADFRKMLREALRSGKIRMGDGTTVTRGEAKAEAA